jgi:hypothetical protein
MNINDLLITIIICGWHMREIDLDLEIKKHQLEIGYFAEKLNHSIQMIELRNPETQSFFDGSSFLIDLYINKLVEIRTHLNFINENR